MNANEPLFSVIIPARDAIRYVEEAIRGILRQDVPGGLEIVFVDDASTDGCGGIAANLGCKVIAIPPSGPVAARNVGLRHAAGTFILFHDADDVMAPDGLGNLHDAMVEQPGCQVVLAQRTDFLSPELTVEERSRIVLRAEPYFGAMAGCALIRREVFDLVGPFDESVRAGETHDWLEALQRQSIRVAKLNLSTVNRRLHNHNYGRVNREGEYMDFAKILRRKLRAHE